MNGGNLWTPVLAVKPNVSQLFAALYDRRNDPNNSLMDIYGRWATIQSDGSVGFGAELRISRVSFPAVFAGILLKDKIPGWYDPVCPPEGVNLHWWYAEWPPPPEEPPDFQVTAGTYRGHVGEYNGAWASEQFVCITWTDSRLRSAGSRWPANQRDVRFIRLPWPQ